MIATIFIASFTSPAVAGSTATEAAALMQRGEYKKAAAMLEKAHAENPADPEITVLYAVTLSDAPKALEMLKKVALDKSAPDSLRSEAYFRLGCANYLWSRFHKAAGYFISAAGLSGRTQDVEACYLNAIHDTIDSSFTGTMRKVAEDTAMSVGKTANFYLGVYYFAKRNYTRALTHFGACIDSSDSAARACAAAAGAYVSAAGLSRREKADSVLAFINKKYPAYLEKAMVDKAAVKAVAPAKKDSLAKKDTGMKKDTANWLAKDSAAGKDTSSKAMKPAEKKPVYSLQVGAFGEMANAQSLKVNLSAQFSSVVIVSGVVSGKTVYRVHVGAFDTREKAQAFGDSSLVKKGLKFQIVEEIKDK